MHIIQILFSAFLVLFVLVDYVFMQKSQRRVWKFIAIVFLGAALLSLFPESLSAITTLTGVGRPVDFFIYLACAILTRELFLSRARDLDQRAQVTHLVRELAIRDAERVTSSATTSGDRRFPAQGRSS